MNLSELSIRRPVMVVLLSLSLILAGVLAYSHIPVAALPSYNTPVINVSADLPGASPETMASSVALPLDDDHLDQHARQYFADAGIRSFDQRQ
jgi:hydrophobic/amphiphilic exporter-1 (mainly G- bacteria), HAE1 family